MENLFVSFDSPEAAYNYYSSSYKASLVVRGEECDLVVGNKGAAVNQLIVPKGDDGWKIGTSLQTKIYLQTSRGDICATIYRYRESDEFFISVYSIRGDELSLEDSMRTEFVHFQTEGDFNVYYGNLRGYTSDYVLRVNGEAIVFG